MTAPAPLLTLDGVSKRFGRVTVAADLSLTVAAHEAVGVVGPNGAGKTTLFSMVSGDVAPDAGRVVLAGRDVTGVDPATRCRLGLARTYQVPRSFEQMTVFENALVATQQGAGLRAQQAYDVAIDVLELTDLRRLANQRAGALTLLQRKRLEVARALATRPQLLLLDEVAGGLTDAEVEELVAIITRVHGSGVTIIWIEHVVRALTSMVTRLVCLAGGGIVADGPPQDVLESEAVREVYLGGAVELAGEDTFGADEGHDAR